MGKDESQKGAFWIDKLKDLFKNEKREEEEDSWLHNSNSQENLGADFESQSDRNEHSGDTDEDEISFLKYSDSKGKDANRQIYQKIADAFLDENSMINDGNNDSLDEEEWKLKLYKQEQKVRKDNENEFDEAFDAHAQLIQNKEILDIVEMDEFDRIKLYQDHTIWQKIYKKVWFIKSEIDEVSKDNLQNDKSSKERDIKQSNLLFDSDSFYTIRVISNTAYKIVKSSQFETMSLLVILFNSFTLAMDDPTTNNDNNATQELALLLIYTVEMVIKIVGLGFVLNEGSYLRDLWNVVDIIIIGTGYLPYMSSNSSLNLSALRSLRVLRPLKSVSKIKSLKLLLQALFSAIPLLKDSLIILGFFFIIFGIAGLQLFIGQLKSRCIDPSNGVQTGDDGPNVIVCATDNDCLNYMSPAGVAYACGKMMISPFYDVIQFDTFGWSVLRVYVVVSLEGWTQIMDLMQQGFSMYSFFYFFFAVYIGAFFLLNLTMAIIAVKYSEAIKDQKKKVAVSSGEEGFSLKNLIAWGIYKSNKIYYKELEEQKKTMKISFFGFSINNLARSLQAAAQLSVQQRNEVRENEMVAIEPQNNQQPNEIPFNDQEILIPIPPPQREQVATAAHVFPSLGQQPNQNNENQQNNHERQNVLESIEEQEEQKQNKPDNSKQNEGDRPNQTKGFIVPPLMSAIGLGNSLRSISSKQSKVVQKRITRIDVGITPKKIGGSGFKIISPRNNGDPINDSKMVNGVGPSQFAANVNGDEVLEDPAGSRSQISSDHLDSQSNTIIMPHLMVGQLELINKKSGKPKNQRLEDSYGISKEKSRIANYKGRHRLQQRTFKPILASNMKTLNVGDRQISLAPIQSKMKDKIVQAQQVQIQQQQALMKAEGHTLQGSRRLSTNIGNLRSLRLNQKGESQSSPRDILDSIQDEYNLSVTEFHHEMNGDKSRATVMNPAHRRQSKRGLGLLPKGDILGSTVRSNNRIQGLIGGDDWMENDEFLEEIEQKEKVAAKFLSSADVMHGGHTDNQIEEAYFISGIGMNMLKDSKKKGIDNAPQQGGIRPLKSGSFIHENNFKQISVHRDENGKERSGSNQRRIMSGKRLRNGHSSHSGSNSLNQNSHTGKTLTVVDNLSEDSEMSIYQVNPSGQAVADDSIASGVRSKTAGITIFNDLDFLDAYPHASKKPPKVVDEAQQQKKTEIARKLKTIKEDYAFKRQESRKVNHRYQGNIGLIDDKFDLKKEETRLLLDSKYLKARVLYGQQRDYIDDILPTKKQTIRDEKKAEQARKLRSLPFIIHYQNTKRIQKPKKEQSARVIPFREAVYMEYLVKNRRMLNELDQTNLDRFIKDSKGGSQFIKRNQSIQNPIDFQSHLSPVFKINEEVSAKQFPSQHNIGGEESSMRDVGSQKFIDNMNGQLSNPHLSESRISEKGDEQVRSVHEAATSIKKGQTFQKQINSTKLISEGTINMNGQVQFNDSPSFKHQTSLARSKTKKMFDGKISDSIVGEDSLNRSKMNTNMKTMKNAVLADKKAQSNRKKDQDIKWTAQIALDRIFNEQDVVEEKKKVLSPIELIMGQSQGPESVGDRTLFASSMGKSFHSDSFSSKSGVNSDTASMHSMRDFDQDMQASHSNSQLGNTAAALATSKQGGTQGNEISEDKFMDIFAAETIENEFVKIRKKEILNIESRGIRTIFTEWSADSVLHQKFSSKSMHSIDRMISTLNHDKFETDQNEGGIIGIIQAIRRRMKYFAHSSFFENSVMMCVIINTVILSLDGIVTSESGLTLMSDMNYIFTIIFACDMFLKILGEGISAYASDKMNIFDALIVCLSLFEMIFLTGSGSSFSAFRAVRILRVFRVLRVTRLIRSLKFMKLMMTALGSAIQQFIYILLLLFLFMFIYTLLGMSIFGGNLNVPNLPTRMNFDKFFRSAFTVLQLLTVENWNDLLTLTIRSPDVNNYISILYLISWIFIGNYVFMNLLLAVIMDSFDSAEVQADKKDIESQFEVIADLDLNHQSVGTTFLNQTTSLHLGSQTQSIAQSHNNLSRSQTSLNKSQSKHQSSDQHSLKSNSQRDKKQAETDSIKESQVPSDVKSNQGEVDEDEDEDGEEGQEKKSSKKKQFEYFVGVKCEKAFFFLSKENFFRKIAYRIYKHSSFDQTILMAIMLSSLKLTIDTYITDTESTIYSIGQKFDLAFTVTFALESIVKILSLGFVLDEGSYLRDEWSQLDFFIVVSSLIDVSMTSIDLSAIKVLRLLRTLRPLRLLNHNKSMKLIVTALMESVGGIANMVVVVLLIWLMFAILGLNLMKDKLNYCNFNSTINYNAYAYHQDSCNALGAPAVWSTYDINCDNIGSSMLFLFILSSFEGWPNYVYNFIDADDSGPILNNSSYFAGFFFVFIFVGSFFSINLFSAIMSFNFDIAQKKAKNQYLSDDQAMWIELQRMIVKSNPDFASLQQPENKFRYYLWRFVQSQFIEVFVIICILANIVTMAMAYDTSPASYDAFLQDVNLFFSGVFFTECVLKLIAFGPSGYFFSSWNRFDFFVVLASILDFSLTQVGSGALTFLKSGPQLARAMRVLRVSRLLKLIKSFQNLQKLIQTTIYALPSLMNATALFMLFYFIFAVLGNFLFGNVNSGTRIDSLNNFSNFHSSFVILFRCSTGEDWMTIMFDVVHKTNTWSVMFFVFFIVTQSYIMMNLFVLIIINQFEENYIDPDNPLQNFREQEESFKKLWVLMTKKESGIKIHERFLPDFYFDLKQPLGYDYPQQKKLFTENLKLYNRDITEEEIQQKCDKFKVKQRQEADKRIMQMNIFCDYEGYIYFNELFFFLFKFSLDEEINDFGSNETKAALDKKTEAIAILRKEEIITIKKISLLKKKQSALMKQKIMAKRKEGVNPMVRRLFVGMCFASWLQFSKNTQKKINQMNFNDEDISSESDTDSSNEADEKEKDDFFKAEDDEGIQFRSTNNKKAIIQREHTIFKRNAAVKDREANNLIEQDKYIFLPNTDIYKDDFVQMGEGANYYSMRVFTNQQDPTVASTQNQSEKSKDNNVPQTEARRVSVQAIKVVNEDKQVQGTNGSQNDQKEHEGVAQKPNTRSSSIFKQIFKPSIPEEEEDDFILKKNNIPKPPQKGEEMKEKDRKKGLNNETLPVHIITINQNGNGKQHN